MRCAIEIMLDYNVINENDLNNNLEKLRRRMCLEEDKIHDVQKHSEVSTENKVRQFLRKWSDGWMTYWYPQGGCALIFLA